MHDVMNYSILKAKIFWTPAGGEERDLGNVPEATFTPNVEFLDHFSSREGVRKKDRTVVVEQSGELSIALDERTVENVAMAVLGVVAEQEVGDPGYDSEAPTQLRKVSVLATSEIVGSIRIVGTNDIGTLSTAEFPRVSFKGGDSIGFISDEWDSFTLTGEVLYDEEEGTFGTIYERDRAAEAEA